MNGARSVPGLRKGDGYLMYLEIDEGFATHRKTLRFCALMQDHNAFAYILRLWTWACRSAPSGVLAGMEAMDIEIAVQYRPADGKCYAAFVKAGFVDEKDPGTPSCLHNWMNRTGGAIKKMATEALRKKIWRDAHGGSKCPGKDKCEICRGLSADNPKTVRGPAQDFLTQTSQDQTSQDQTSFEGAAGAPAIAAPVAPTPPAIVTPITKPWHASEWLRKFAAAWCDRYGRIAYGQGEDDAKATASLGDLLASLPPDERRTSEIRAPVMLAEYLADEAPGRLKHRHPFKWFVADFNGLRVPKVEVKPAHPRCWFHQKPGTASKKANKPDRDCIDCKHHAAAGGRREGDPTAAVTALPTIAPPPEWSDEQKAELAASLTNRRGGTGPPAHAAADSHAPAPIAASGGQSP